MCLWASPLPAPFEGEPARRNYHYPHQGGKEHIFSKPLSAPRYFGSYMTDIVKDCSAITARALEGLVGRDSKALDYIMAKCVPALEKELAALEDIQKIRQVFLFGGTAYTLWQLSGLSGPATQITHFAARGSAFSNKIYGELGITPPGGKVPGTV